VDVLADAVGYYTNSTLKELATGLGTANSTLKELATGLGTANSKIAALEAAGPFAVTAEELPIGTTTATALTTTPIYYVTVEVTAPVAGQVTVNSFATVGHDTDGQNVGCKILESTEPDGIQSGDEAYLQWFEAAGSSLNGTLAGTRVFNIAADETKTYGLRCREYVNGGYIRSRVITAIFTPAP
jgi:hypothetical protein